MNRKLICEAQYGITLAQRMNQTQSWLLAGPQNRGVTAVDITATAQRPLLLQSVAMESSLVGGVIDSFKVAGQEVNVATGTIPIGVFAPNSGGTSAAQRVLGIAVNNNMTVQIQATQSGVGNCGFTIGCLPISSDQVPSTSGQASMYNYIAGLGVTAAMATGGGTGSCSATILRAVWLGEIVFSNQDTGSGAVPNNNIQLTDLLVNGLSMMAGASDQVAPLNHLVATQSDTPGFRLNIYVPANSTVEAKFTNQDATNTAIVGAAIFIEPFAAPVSGGITGSSPQKAIRLPQIATKRG
jgi:hypothetical protein